MGAEDEIWGGSFELRVSETDQRLPYMEENLVTMETLKTGIDQFSYQ